MAKESQYGIVHNTEKQPGDCQSLLDGTCTNPDSDQCCDYPHPEYCLYRCPHYSAE